MKSNIHKLKSECEILKLRRDNLASEIIKQDEKIDSFINDVSISTILTNELNIPHNEEINRDMVRIKSQRKKKNISTKEAFQRDKNKYFELYKDILPQRQDIPTNNYHNCNENRENEINNAESIPPQHSNKKPSKNEVHRYPTRKKPYQQS